MWKADREQIPRSAALASTVVAAPPVSTSVALAEAPISALLSR